MLYPLSYGGSRGAVPLYPVPVAAPTLDRTALLRRVRGRLLASPCSPSPRHSPRPRPGSSPTPPTRPRFTADSTAIADGWAVTLADPNATVPAGKLVSLRREGRPLPPWPREPMIVLANGDRIRGEVIGGDTRTVRFTPARHGAKAEPWAVPLTALAAVWVTPPPADTPPDPAAYPWADGPRRRDAVLLRNGDVLRGTVDGFAADPPAVRIKATGDPAATTLPLSRRGGGRVRPHPRPRPQAEGTVRPARHRRRLAAFARRGDRGREHPEGDDHRSGPRSRCRSPTWSPSTCSRGRRRTCPT